MAELVCLILSSRLVEQCHELSFTVLPTGVVAFESFLDYFRKKNLQGISSLPCAAVPVASNLHALGESLHPDVLGIGSEIFIFVISSGPSPITCSGLVALPLCLLAAPSTQCLQA